MSATAPEHAPASDPALGAIAGELGAQSHDLERIERHLRQPELEDCQTFAIPATQTGPYVFDPAVPATAEYLEISAWQSGPAPSAVVVVDGNEPSAESLVANNSQADWVDVLFAVPASGVATVRRPGYSGKLTVYALQAPTNTVLVTVRIRAHLRPEKLEHR